MNSASKRIKVVHIVTRMNTGGVAVLISEIFNGYDRNNFDFTLITGSCQSDEENYLQARNFDLDEITVSAMRRSLNPIKDLTAFIKILRILFRLKPDIVHTHTSKAGLIGRIAATIGGPKAAVVHTYHGHLLQGYFSKLATFFLVFTEKNLAKITDVLIAMGTHVEKQLLAAGIGKEGQFHVMFPGVADSSIATNNSKVEEIRTTHANSVICIFVGRLSPIKRCNRIIELAQMSSIREKAIHFLIVGDGELKKELELMSRDLPISFLGWQSNAAEWLAISDIAILCSDNEAVPLALIEAGFAGLPVIATNVGSVQDVVVNGVNGILTSTKIEEIASAVLKLAEEPELRKKMGKEGRRLARDKFSTQAMILAHQEIYSHIMRNKNSGFSK